MTIARSIASGIARSIGSSLDGVGGGVVSQTLILGKTTPGDQTATVLSENYVWATGPYLAESSGTIQSISIYTNQANAKVTLGVWEDVAGVIGPLVAVSAEGTPLLNDWITLDASGNIVAGKSYWFGWNFTVGRSMSYDVAPAGSLKYKASAYSAGVMPDPYPASPAALNRRYPIYVTYQT